MTNRRPGITLTEVVISIPLIGLVMVGAMTSTGSVLRTWNDARDLNVGRTLAHDLLAEIMHQPYSDPEGGSGIGSDPGEGSVNRRKWDDVDDYHGWSFGSPPRDKDHNALSGYSGWSRTASISYASLADPTQNSGVDSGLKRITVIVTSPAGEVTTLVGYRSGSGAMEHAPAVDTTVQGYISHQLEVNGNTLYRGANLPNGAE